MVDSRLAQVIRIGMQFISADPFWVMVREGIYQRAEQLQVTLVPVEVDLWPLSGEKQMEVIEEILALDLHGLVTQGMGATLARLVADAGVPGVFLTETDLQHRLVSSPRGLYEAARMAALFVADKIDRRGQVLIVGGLAEGFDRGFLVILPSLIGFTVLRVRKAAVLISVLPGRSARERPGNRTLRGRQTCNATSFTRRLHSAYWHLRPAPEAFCRVYLRLNLGKRSMPSLRRLSRSLRRQRHGSRGVIWPPTR